MTAKGNLLKLHIGCGPVILPGWINIDIDHIDAEVHTDVTQGLEYTDSSIAFIFAEHFIEHLPRPGALNFLRECWRVLQPGGVVRLSTPDLDEIVDAYLARDTGRWGALWQPDTPCRLINEAFHSWGHQFLYNRSEMVTLLREAGFRAARWCEYGKSLFAELSNLEARPFHKEIIVEATRT